MGVKGDEAELGVELGGEEESKLAERLCGSAANQRGQITPAFHLQNNFIFHTQE
jgi:hypothetical protein